MNKGEYLFITESNALWCSTRKVHYASNPLLFGNERVVRRAVGTKHDAMHSKPIEYPSQDMTELSIVWDGGHLKTREIAHQILPEPGQIY